jgi:hypothetical protein
MNVKQKHYNMKDFSKMTIGEVTKIASLFSEEKNNNILQHAIGKYCLVRSRNEGINAGVVVDADETGVVLKEARRIYYHKPKDRTMSWYEGVAESGLHEDSKISGVTQMKVIVEDYSLTICSQEAEQNIRNHVAQGS